MCAFTKKTIPPYTWSQFFFIDALPETIKYHGGFPILKWFSFFYWIDMMYSSYKFVEFSWNMIFTMTSICKNMHSKYVDK